MESVRFSETPVRLPDGRGPPKLRAYENGMARSIFGPMKNSVIYTLVGVIRSSEEK
jgi:hypothetical protein